MKEQKIITHPGSAHFDDITAVSLILAVYDDMDFTIERREPIPEELEDPDIWVIGQSVGSSPLNRGQEHL